MKKMYQVREPLKAEERERLKEFSDLLAHLLYHRNIKDSKEASSFISPSYEKLHDPYLLRDMEEAVERILRAIKTNQKIVIFSDYDADGIPGAVIFHDFLKQIGYTNFIIHIPHRGRDGFGLNIDAIKNFVDQGCKLLITIDCGISDFKEVSFANENGIDVIITDHHLPVRVCVDVESRSGLPKEKLPDAYAIINAKVSPNYPEKMLCGAATAFKLIQAILVKDRFGVKDGWEKWLLDMVGIATLSDMVPLQGENRIFSYFGLLVLRKSRRIGLKSLLTKLKINQKKITEDDIGFMISPRINAVSRMDKSWEAFQLFVTEDLGEAEQLVSSLEEINNERKGVTAYISKEVKKMVEAKYSPYFSNKIIVVGNPTWKPSLLGLVASSIAEIHNKPVFLWGREGAQEALKGSCRSLGVIDVSRMMAEVSPQVLTEYGGHTLAGGFSVSYESVHLLEEELSKAYDKLSFDVAEELVWIDKEVDIMDVSISVLNDLEKIAPFGIGNKKPIFLIKNVFVSKVEYFGKEKNHLKLKINKNENEKIEAIAFFAPEKLTQKAEPKKGASIIGHIERSFFGSNPLRIRILDII